MKNLSFKLLLFISIVLICSMASEAAEYAFRVVEQRGSATIKHSGSSTTQVKVGAKIKNGDVVTVGESASLGLCHSSGKSIKLTAGTYTVEQIEYKLASGKSSSTEKLAKSVFEGMGKGDNMMQTSSLKGKTSIPGAGQRGTVGITPLTAYKSRQFADNIIFKWSRFANESNYKFTITNIYDEIIYSVGVKDTMLVTSNHELKLKPEDYYFWFVSPQTDTTVRSKSVGFVVLSPQKITAIKETESLIKTEFTDDLVFQKLILSKLYEQNELIDPAWQLLNEAIKANPDDQDLLLAYQMFIVRNKIPE